MSYSAGNSGNGSQAGTKRQAQNPADVPGARIPPHSLEAEEAVLGGILLDNDAINDALELLVESDFYRAANQAIFGAMTALFNKSEPIDIVTLGAELRARNLLEQSGGLENLARLGALVPSAASVGFYAKIVKGMAARRKLIHEATNIISEAYKVDGDVDDFLNEAEQRILSAAEQRNSQGFCHIDDLVKDSILLIEQLYDKKESITGVPTGFDRLDQMTAGLQPSDLIIIAARPSMGKTSLALCIATYAGVALKKPVAIFSLEMSKEQLALRMLSSEARVDFSKVRTGALGERDFPKLVDAASRITDSPVYIDDTPGLTVTELRAKARRLHQRVHGQGGLGLIVVDYLQLMRSPSKDKQREQEISDISRSLKALAKELRVPVISLSQLNRSVESRDNKRPMMSDLRESGAIEQDADVIMFIYRDEVYNKETPDKGVAELIIAKQRNGPTGPVRVAFSPEFTRFDRLEESNEITQLAEAEAQSVSDTPDWGNTESF